MTLAFEEPPHFPPELLHVATRGQFQGHAVAVAHPSRTLEHLQHRVEARANGPEWRQARANGCTDDISVDGDMQAAVMRARVLPPDEWPRLDGTPLGPIWRGLSSDASIVVVEDEAGAIVGLSTLVPDAAAHDADVRARHAGLAAGADDGRPLTAREIETLRRMEPELEAMPFSQRRLQPTQYGGGLEPVPGTGGAGTPLYDEILQRAPGTAT